ncbi:hypothetical protein [Microbacterium lacticum]|uniref:hypothetical protein n=1 Tax=Microbacterium lacticum TaxID=33885 RepID=UPI001F59DE77|nr:hypothetical protein [Microbacterium lacticum]
MALSKSEQDHYSALAARAEDETYFPVELMDTLATGEGTTSGELGDLVCDLEALPASVTPAGVADGRATEEDLQELIALGDDASPSGLPESNPPRGERSIAH